MTQEEFRQSLDAFLSEWHNDSPTLEVHTSGSTGTPKALQVEKKRMEASARQTCRFLGLKAGDTALLCMPLPYIAGKMVVVRSLVAGLKLIPVTPCGHPLAGLTDAPVFAAMIPMQVYNSLHVPEERELLAQIKHLIIGGGAIDTALAEELKDFPHAVWSTYGMTETLSHIALRRLNGSDASDWYTPFDGVHIQLSEEGTLIIYAPEVCPDELTTNDIAEINAEGRFRILGRKDNIINSGGVKIQIEQVEAALREHISTPFQITSAPDKKFGEVVAMLYEEGTEAELRETCRRILPPYRVPKRYVRTEKLPLTETGKPDRATAKQIVLKVCV
ncbi:MAG: AMP-binding protein [Bacteroides sp.]|nr:AMP-binding protein [Bacteroides sp.]